MGMRHKQIPRFGDYVGDSSGIIAERYQILSELGEGGMARVYRARDLRQNAEVAFKLLRREYAASVGAKRFAREIRIASALAHPNILPVLDSGLMGDLPFYVMPLVGGETLQSRLHRERQLPIRDAVKLAGEVAAALSYAHAQGVVHRDVKPGNIFVSNGYALVLDFGIARHIDGEASERLTESGVALGTAYYMSPEQACAGPVDGRGDTYSLGCVLYEMIAGQPPFRAASPQQVLQSHATDPVPSLVALRAETPVALEAAILRALAKSSSHRYADPLDFKAAIEKATPPRELSWFQALRAKLSSPA